MLRRKFLSSHKKTPMSLKVIFPLSSPLYIFIFHYADLIRKAGNELTGIMKKDMISLFVRKGIAS